VTPDEPASARPADERLTSPRDASAVRGLSADDERKTADAYFAAFRWEPPAIDPAWLTAADFLSMLDDALVAHDDALVAHDDALVAHDDALVAHDDGTVDHA
jgi:hypothetical protein